MPESPETTREITKRHDLEAVFGAVILEKFDGLEKLTRQRSDAQDAVLATIKEQTIKTNGHVADAFKEIGDLKRSRDSLMGGLRIVSALVLPVVLFFLYKQFSK